MKDHRRRDRTAEDEINVSSMLHATILSELFRSMKWQAQDAVFHGGTSLKLLRNSPRHSEDLDFMVTHEAAEKLAAAMERILERVRSRMRVLSPGCTIDLKGPKGRSVEAWTFTWSHPEVIGNVKVKAEFLVTSPESLAAYQSTHLLPTGDGLLTVAGRIPVPTLLSAWSDKVVAMGKRPVLKWRDVFDLDYIVNSMRMTSPVSWEEKMEALASTGRIYGYTADEVVKGLEARLASGELDDGVSFEQDMRRFFDVENYEEYVDGDMFRHALESTKGEIEAVVRIFRNGNRPGW